LQHLFHFELLLEHKKDEIFLKTEVRRKNKGKREGMSGQQ